ncbi:C1 family peptidase [bacterium]|nr:C1 family peptidase [bacterium]
MIRFTTTLLAALGLCAALACAQTTDGGLTLKQSHEILGSVRLDDHTRAAMNAVTNNDIRSLALNRDVVAVEDDIFSFSLPTKGITNQESSGRCWLFAGLNLVRQDAAKKWDMDEFEFSQSYFAFWDLFEKSNAFLEYVIKTRERDIMDRELSKQLEDPVGDGGYWPYVVSLVEKYGVVPKKVMGETNSSANTGRMHAILTALLRRDAATLRSMAASGKSAEELRAEKAKMLPDVMRLLVINYGVPPTEFEWRTTDTTGKASDPVTFTPQDFYKEVVQVDFSEYVTVACYPNQPFGKNYSISATNPMADEPDISFINVDAKTMKDLALKALLDSNRVWFGCDVGQESYSKKGLLVRGVYNYEELFGLELDMNKPDRLNYRSQSSNHAMVLVGVDIVDGKPRKWRVENSWGKDRGDDGFFTMSDDWFDEYVMDVIVPVRYLPADVLAITKQDPIPLPIWDPAWESLRMK